MLKPAEDQGAAKKSDFAKRTKRLEEKTPDQLTEEQAFPASVEF